MGNLSLRLQRLCSVQIFMRLEVGSHTMGCHFGRAKFFEIDPGRAMLNKGLITIFCLLSLCWSLSFPFLALCSPSCLTGVMHRLDHHACCDHRLTGHEFRPSSRCECSLRSHRLAANEVSLALSFSGQEDLRSSPVGARLSSQSAPDTQANGLRETPESPLTFQHTFCRTSSLRI